MSQNDYVTLLWVRPVEHWDEFQHKPSVTFCAVLVSRAGPAKKRKNKPRKSLHKELDKIYEHLCVYDSGTKISICFYN